MLGLQTAVWCQLRNRRPAVGLLLLLASTAWAAPPWHYRLEVGDRLVYERRAVASSFSSPQNAQRSVDQIRIWCLDKQDTEVLILLDLIHVANERIEPVRGVVLRLDERGRRRMPEVTQMRVTELEAAFEVIPLLRLPLTTGPDWRTAPDLYGLPRQCTLLGPDAERAGHLRVEYAVECPDGVGDVLGYSHAGRYWFDPAAGVVTRVESLYQNRAADLRREATTILRQRDHLAASWIVRRADEARVYQQTLAHEDRLLDGAVFQPQQIERTLERLHRLWSGSLPDFERGARSPFRRLGRARQKRLAADVKSLRADAQYARRWLGRPAAPWSLSTSSGETLTSEQVRAGVTIECLWSARRPDFLATLAALRDLQPQLPDGQVRIVCLNMDTDLHLARRVLDCLPPGLTCVLAGPLRAVEAPPRLPIVRVLDRHGMIRRLWIGWRPSYAAALAEAQRWAE